MCLYMSDDLCYQINHNNITLIKPARATAIKLIYQNVKFGAQMATLSPLTNPRLKSPAAK